MYEFLFNRLLVSVNKILVNFFVFFRYLKGEIPLRTQITMNSRIGRKTILGNKSIINNSNLSSETKIGINCRVGHSTLSGKVKVGNYTTINKSIIIGRLNPINIGKFCSIAPDVYITDINHNLKRRTTHFMYKYIDVIDKIDELKSNGGVEIGNDVWIGKSSIILSGITIGDGAVIAAGSIVTKDVEPYSVVAGIPAKLIKKRFNDNIIKKLIKEKWWNLSIQELTKKEKKFFDEID